MLIIAFIVLIIVGLYTGELGKKGAIIYFCLASVSVGSVVYFDLHQAVWLLSLGLIDVFLVIHVFKGDIAIRRI